MSCHLAFREREPPDGWGSVLKTLRLYGPYFKPVLRIQMTISEYHQVYWFSLFDISQNSSIEVVVDTKLQTYSNNINYHTILHGQVNNSDLSTSTWHIPGFETKNCKEYSD